MNRIQGSTERTAASAATPMVDMRLEVVVLPVADVDRAKRFYASLGWRLDGEFADGDFRIMQLTPPGSGASIIFGTNVTTSAPGSVQGLHLVVSDIEAAREDLLARGVAVSEVFHDVGGVFHHAGREGRVTGPDPQHRSYGSFVSFEDPDGNGWLLQEVTTRLPGRIDPTSTAFGSAEDLKEALLRAEKAHGEHEARLGARDVDWPTWYAEYMVRERAGRELPS